MVLNSRKKRTGRFPSCVLLKPVQLQGLQAPPCSLHRFRWYRKEILYLPETRRSQVPEAWRTFPEIGIREQYTQNIHMWNRLPR